MHLLMGCQVPARGFPLDKERASPQNASGTPPACVRRVLGRAKSARPGGKAGLGSLPGKNDTPRVALALGVTLEASSTREQAEWFVLIARSRSRRWLRSGEQTG